MELNSAEKERLKSFLVELYGDQASTWPMTVKMFDLTMQLLNKSGKCSDLVDLVPRPIHPGQSVAKWLSKQVRGMILRKLKSRRRHYAACLASSAAGMKPDFWLAAQGL